MLTLIFPSLLPRHTGALNCHRTSLATVTPFRAFQVLMSCGEVKRRKKELREIPLIPKPPSLDFSLKSIRQDDTGMWMVQIYKSCQYVYTLPKRRTLQSIRLGNMIFSCHPCSTLTYRMASSARRRDGYRELLKLAAAATSEPLCKGPRPPHRQLEKRGRRDRWGTF